MRHVSMFVLAVLALLLSTAPLADPLTTAFTYQGNLNQSGNPANGSYDLEFRLFSSPTEDIQLGSTQSLDSVSVTDGVFTVLLDFGPGIFVGEQVWLEIRVKQSDDPGGLSILAPRQELTAAPYAIYAQESDIAVTALDVAWNDVRDRPAGLDDGDDDTLGGLGCSEGEIAKFSGGGWICSTDLDSGVGTDTLAELSCANGQVAKWDGTAWVCADDTDTDTDTDTTYTAGAGLELNNTEFSARGTPYANVVVVAKSGGDFTSVASALASITDAAVDNPYLVWVGPGRYSETVQAEVPSHVHLKGAGEAVTTITAEIGSVTHSQSATMRLDDLGKLSDVTVENTGTSSLSTGVYVSPTTRDTKIQNVTARANGSGGTGHFGFYLADAEAHLINVHASATGATVVNTAVGIVNASGGFPQTLIDDSILLGGNNGTESCTDPTGTGIALQLSSAAPKVVDSYLCGGHRTISAAVNGTTQIHRSRILGGSSGTMVETTGAAVVIIAGSYVQYITKYSGLSSGLLCVNNYKSNWTPASDGTTSTTACN